MRRTVTACLTVLVVAGLGSPSAAVPAGRVASPTPTPVSAVRPGASLAAAPVRAIGAAHVPVPAHRDRIARLEQDASEARATIERFDEEIADLVEKHNELTEDLVRTRQAMRETDVRLDRAGRELAAAKDQLHRRARAIYMYEHDPVSRYGQLLSVRSLGDVAAAHGYQTWVLNADERALTRVTLARRSLQSLSQRQAAQHERQRTLDARLKRERQAIERRIAEERDYLERLNDQLRAAIAAEEEAAEERRHQALMRRIEEDLRQHGAGRGDGWTGGGGGGRPARVGRGGGASARGAVDWAMRQIGKPYRWGASGPGSFDCSGLTMRAYANAGVQLPRTSRAQFHAGGRVRRISDLRPGDLVFFGRSWQSINHVGMYIGGGRMVHAPNSGSSVRVSSIARRNYVGATRPTG